MDSTVARRILHQAAEDPIPKALHIEVVMHSHDDLDARRLRPPANDLDRLRVAGLRDKEERTFLVSRVAEKHRHRFGSRRTLVEERSVGNLEAREIDHHGLEVEERLQTPLRDLGLVRRVLRVPPRVFQDISQDHTRNDRVVVPHPDVRAEDTIPRADLLQPPQKLVFGRGLWKVQRPVEPNRLRNRLVHQLVELGDTKGRQHLLDLVIPGTDVAAAKPIPAT